MDTFLTIGIFVGIISGFTFSFLCLSFNKGWATVGSTSGPFVLFLVIYKIMKELGKAVTIDNLLSYIKGCIGSTCLTIFILILVFLIYLKVKKDVPIKLNIINFLFGNEKLKEKYQELTALSAEKKFKLDEYREKIQELNEQIEHYKRQVSVYKQKEKSLNEAIEEGIYLELPYNNSIPLDKTFINEIPLNVSKMLKFYKSMVDSTEKIIQNYKEANDSSIEMAEVAFNYFLDEICQNISGCFFNPQDVRVHFRYLTSVRTYKKITVFSEGKKCDDDLKILKCSEGMINAAIEHKRSLIKSLNPNNHCLGSNDVIWKDYMVIIFDKFCRGKYPQLCMGVDVKNENIYRNIFYFLNLCNLDRTVQNFLTQLNKEINICKVLENKNIVDEAG